MKVKIISLILALMITGVIFIVPVSVGNFELNNDDNAIESNKIKFSLTKYNVLQKKTRIEKNDTKQSQIQQIKKSENIKSIDKAQMSQVNESDVVKNLVKTDLPVEKSNESSSIEIKSKEKKQNTIMYRPDFTIDKIPVYPMSARRMGQEGKVGVTVYVDENGKIINILATKSSGFAVLDKAAINAVKSWKFARLNLKDKVNVIRTEVVFELQ